MKKNIMKKMITISIMTAIMASMSTIVFAGSIVDLVVKNKAIELSDSSMGSPYIENGRTYVPIRVVSENLGYKVDWIKSTETVIITKTGTILELKIGETKANINGVNSPIELDSKGNIVDTKVVLKSGRTYVPIRFIAEAMGEKVEYRDPGSSSVYNKTVFLNYSALKYRDSWTT